MKEENRTRTKITSKLLTESQSAKSRSEMILQMMFIVLLLLIVVCPALGQDISRELKSDHKVVRILDNEGIVPGTVIVKRGTTVIWVSYFTNTVQIKFAKSRVTTACRQPINFITAEDGTFQSNPLKTGATASLCFIEKGEYVYQFKPRNVEWANIDSKGLKGLVKVY